MLAESMEGYRSLCRLITEYRTSSEDRRRPVCPVAYGGRACEGVICLTGAVPFGLLPRGLSVGRPGRKRSGLCALCRRPSAKAGSTSS